MRRATFALLLLAAAPLGAADPVRQGPKPLSPQHAGVGRMAPDLAGTDLAGKPVRLSEVGKDRKAVVVALTSTSCPVSKKYLPALAKLEAEYGPKGVGFVFLNPVATDEPADPKVTGAYLHDKDGALAKALGARTTADTFVLDAKRTVVYCGAIDDRYGPGYALDAPKHTYLADALDAVLAGKPVAVPATTAPGCDLDLSAAKAPAGAAVTYHNTVSRIVQTHCVECHRSGGVAPFPLETHKDVVARKGMIRTVVDGGTMPPWFAARDGKHPTKWANDRSLTEADKTDLLFWLAAGTPAGDPADAPLPKAFPGGWAIGKPDLVLQLPKPVAVKAEGTMPYQHALVETGLTEDKWVSGFEIRPTDRGVVHHVLVFVLPPGADDPNLPPAQRLARFREGAAERRGFFAAYVPGNDHQIFAPGFARKLPKDSKLLFQIHYTPNGTATQDRMKIGFTFAREAPRHELKVIGIANQKISIPPGTADHPEVATLKLPADAVVTAFMPHMHVRGKACHYEMTTPDGQTVPLLAIPRYDFNWQLKYELAEPVTLPKGSMLRFHARYDNSTGNPANPDPTKTVRWGQQTYEEMMLGYIEYYLPK